MTTAVSTNRAMIKPVFTVKDPVSTLTHFVAFLASVIAMPWLLIKGSADGCSLATLVSLTVFMMSMVLLYGASSAYHAFVLPYEKEQVLKKLDHMSIFILIAGSYTPICISALGTGKGLYLLIAVWAVALGGLAMKFFWVNCPKFISSIVYIAMGWLVIFTIRDVYAALGAVGFAWLLTGGIIYTVGGILYSVNLRFSKNWGNHEVFHVLVMAGSLCHFITMLCFVA